MGEVLDEADLLYVAVATRRGPHVTPTVFDVEGRRLWFVVPRDSVKARAIARQRQIGGLAQVGERAVMVGGRARIIDPLTGRGVFSLDRILGMPLAATGYLGRNYRHAVGILQDRPDPALPLSRVVVAVSLSRVALLEGSSLTAAWGSWEPRELLLHGTHTAPELPDLSAVPSELHGFLAGADLPVVLGWQSSSGPVALPARWQSGMAEVSGAAMVLAGAGSASPACVIADRSGHRLKHKRGILLAGQGRARLDGDTAQVTVDQERVTWWVGDDSRTVVAAAALPPEQ